MDQNLSPYSLLSLSSGSISNCTTSTSETDLNEDNEETGENEDGLMEDVDRIWPPDVEEALQEAVKKFPACGRRKIMCEGRMYGRNELIARYILLKTGKTRTRKQVSSHLQVQIRKQDRRVGKYMKNSHAVLPLNNHMQNQIPAPPSIDDRLRTISSQKLKWIHFQAYIKTQRENAQRTFILNIRKTSDYLIQPIKFEAIVHKFPPVLMELLTYGPSDAFFVARCWTNFNDFPKTWDPNNFLCDTKFESTHKLEISMRTIVSSFGLPVIDKFETCTSIEEFHEPNNSRYVYEMSEIPMSWFSAKLASELATILETQGSQMVSQVLGNFSILYIIKNMRTDETLLVVAFVVECCERNQDPGSVFYRLVL